MNTKQYVVVVNGVVESIASFGTSNLYAKNQRKDGNSVLLRLAMVPDFVAFEAENNAYWERYALHCDDWIKQDKAHAQAVWDAVTL